jgi:DNA primase
MTWRLSASDIERVRAEHSVVDVLARLGIEPPQRWDGAADYMISCPCPGHTDSTPSCIIHPQTDRWHCFGCGARGDVLELVHRVEGITSLAKIADILHSRRALVPAKVDGVQPPAVSVDVRTAERPDLARTPHERVLAANTDAWRFLSLPKLAWRGRRYLRDRGIDVTALGTETGRPVVGHTPYQDDGLVTHLRSRGFTDDEIVDAGWGSRRDGELIDRFRRRVIIPARDRDGQVIGAYGRDVTGRANQKYLNTAETIAFRKGSAVYRPSDGPLDPGATVIVCEGSIDALAIAAQAASAAGPRSFAPVSPSGTALTDAQAELILAISDRPPLVCADADDPGLAAADKWIRTFMAHGRETIVTLLPDSHDPASWLRQHGADGLRAFVRKGCLALPDDAVKPVPAGALLAERVLAAEVAAARKNDPDIETVMVMPTVVDELARVALQVPGEAAQQRFATAAGHTLARRTDGLDADHRASQVLAATTRAGHVEQRTALGSSAISL